MYPAPRVSHPAPRRESATSGDDGQDGSVDPKEAMSVHLSVASPADVAEAARVVAEAFRDDPVLHGFVPGERDRQRRLELLMRATLSTGPLHRGAIDLARLEPRGPIVGVAAWEGPRDRGAVPWVARLPAWAWSLRAVGLRHLRAARRTQAAFAAARPSAPHWYLDDIVVDARAQGRGVGSALLRAGIARVDSDGRPAYLEATTDDSRRLYERFGFVAQGRIDAPGSPYAMLRPGSSTAP